MPTSTRRLGKTNKNGSRILLVKCSSTELKWDLLKRSKNLKSIDTLKKVYISEDLTKMQQTREKALRVELKRKRDEGGNYVIRKGQVVPRGQVNTFSRENFS